MPTVLVTGFPGFLASAFVPTLLSRLDAGTRVTCLVQPRYRALADERAAEMATASGSLPDRIRLVEGDITRADLGLNQNGRPLRDETTDVYHFAAVYDLAVPRDVGMTVNMGGTLNVLDFIAQCPHFGRLHYVSTCYVSGRHPGRFTEADLDLGQQFNNFYEETKFLAEVEVQRRMGSGLVATIYRPSIVVGDSRTGETQKYDGPYTAIRWMLRWRKSALMFIVGDPRRFHVNVVPRDYVVSAIGHLSGLETSRGQVYQLCDPSPPTVDAFYRILSETTGRRIIKFRVPVFIAGRLFRLLPDFHGYTGILPESMDYSTQPTEYTCENVLRDLRGAGIACPPFTDYAKRLVRFVQDHPTIGSDGMK